MATAVFGIRTRAAGEARLEWRVFLRTLADVDVWRGALDAEELVVEEVPDCVNLDLAEFDRLYAWGLAPIAAQADTDSCAEQIPMEISAAFSANFHPMWAPKKRAPAKHADGRDKTYHIRRAPKHAAKI
jgi:hypothetical protein